MPVADTPMKSGIIPLFAYGTLRDPEIRASVLDNRVSGIEIEAALLPDHTLVRVHGRGYPMIVPQPGLRVEGELLFGLTRQQLRILDGFEGDEYRRGPVAVVRSRSPAVDAHVYRPVVGLRRDRRPWSLDRWSLLERRAMLRRIRYWRQTSRWI